MASGSCSGISAMRSHSERTILLATRSLDKAGEIRVILEPLFRGRIVSLDEAGIEHRAAQEDAVEAFTTFLGNAHAKAAYFQSRSGLATIADDSGISVAALGGAPGVYSRRFAAEPGLEGTALDRANNRLLLERLRDVEGPDRAAHYTCAAALHLPDGRRLAAVGTCSGHILSEPRGHRGFGYDPLFGDPLSGLSFGEIEPHEKNRRSHRARAFRALATLLESVP
jgi:XTP/dITP diphosphohydrolase